MTQAITCHHAPFGAVGAQQRADVGIGPYEKERKPYQPPGAALRARKEQLVKSRFCPMT